MQPYAPHPLNLLRDGYHRYRWTIRGILAVILVPWAFFWAYERLTAEPAMPGIAGAIAALPLDPGLNVPPVDADKTEELAAAINALPPQPTTQPLPTPSEGTKWIDWNPNQSAPAGMIDVSVVLDGPWQPERRLQQMLFIEYMEDPKVEHALRRIAEYSGQPACLPHSSALGILGGFSVRKVCKVFAARSRCRAEQANHDAALNDLQTVIKLGDNIANDGMNLTVKIADSFLATAYSELIVQARTLPQPAESRHTVLQWLKNHPFDRVATWQNAARGQRKFCHAWIDVYYTKDDNGNGQYTIDPTTLTPGVDQFQRVQNLVSWVYEDRQSYLTFLDYLWGNVVPPFYELPYPQAEAMSTMFNSIQVPTHVVPFTLGSFWLARSQACHEITLATLAALTYHADHGHYPDQLTDLVPDYLDDIPNDPFVEKPLRYRLDDQYGFIVYSVGENMRDNGGQAPFGRQPIDEIKDYFFGAPIDGKWREEPHEEWYLVPADAANEENSLAPETGEPPADADLQ